MNELLVHFLVVAFCISIDCWVDVQRLKDSMVNLVGKYRYTSQHQMIYTWELKHGKGLLNSF